MPWLPMILLIVVFSSNILTIVKSIFVFFIILISCRKFYARLFDANLFVILLFVCSYFLLSFIDAVHKTGAPLSILVMPPVMYICGKWIAYKSPDTETIVISFFFIGLSLAGMAFFAITSDISQAGFEQGSRNIHLGDESDVISATVLGGLLTILVSFGGVVFGVNKSFGWIKRAFVIAFFVLSLLAAVRLGSRTLLLIGLICFVIGYLRNAPLFSLSHSIIFPIFMLVAGYLSIVWLSGIIDLEFYFRDRLDTADASAASFGGRLDRWIGSFELIATNPFGWSIEELGYSHNLWLDTARNGGWASFLFLITLTTLYFRQLRKSYLTSKNDPLFTTFTLCLTVGFMLIFMLEPILDGFLYVFSAFCVFFGLISGKRNSLKCG